ncbi:hypothetical protein E3P99_00805 [Wallemia hederae]|uniref:Uncharacterized protein n=1 Tax=Wallemia hederae TaxID=1540922 RepID=A0A4T0FY33_9BASI|nr:hypothetical protein E3P99_00805 [Wallemia hederae]
MGDERGRGREKSREVANTVYTASPHAPANHSVPLFSPLFCSNRQVRMNEIKFNRNLKELLAELVQDKKGNLNELLRKLHKHGKSSDELAQFEMLLRADESGAADKQDKLKGVSSKDPIIANYASLLTRSGEMMSYRSTKLNQFNDREVEELFKQFNDVLILRNILQSPQNVHDVVSVSTYNHLSDEIILRELEHGNGDAAAHYALTSYAIKHSTNTDIHLRHLTTLKSHPPQSISEFLYKTFSLLLKHHSTPKSGHYNTQILDFQTALVDIWLAYRRPLSLIPVINDLLISAQSLSFLSQSNFRYLFYLNKDTRLTADFAVRAFEIYHQLAHKSRQTDARNVNIQLRTLHNDETINQDTVMDLDGDEVYYQAIYDAIPVLLSQCKVDLAKEVVEVVAVDDKHSFYPKKVYLQALIKAYEAEHDPNATSRETLFGRALELTHTSLALCGDGNDSVPVLKLHARLCDQVLNLSDAINALRGVLKRDPHDWSAWLHMSNLLSATDHSGALSVVRSAIDLSEATSSNNDPLAAETVESVERAHSIMKLLILENVLVETTEGVSTALEGHINLFSYFANQIWKSARFGKAMEEFSFAHPSARLSEKEKEDVGYPLKGSASEGALNQHLKQVQTQQRSNASVMSYNTQTSQTTSSQHSTMSSNNKRKSRLHIPHPHISVSGAVGRFRGKKGGANGGVNGAPQANADAQPNHLDTNKVLPRIRVSSVPDAPAATSSTNTQTTTNNSNSNSNSNSAANTPPKPPVDLSDYETRERTLLAQLWLMSASAFRRLGDDENAAHALHMAEETACDWRVYVELARQCAEHGQYALANTALIKAQFLAGSDGAMQSLSTERAYQMCEYEYAAFLFKLGVERSDKSDKSEKEDDLDVYQDAHTHPLSQDTPLHPNIPTHKRLDAVEGILENLVKSSQLICRQHADAHYMLAMCYKTRNRRHKLKSCLEMALRVDRSVGVLALDAME